MAARCPRGRATSQGAASGSLSPPVEWPWPPSLFPSLPTASHPTVQLPWCPCAEARVAVVSTSASLRGSGRMLEGPERAGSALHVRTTSAVL